LQDKKGIKGHFILIEGEQMEKNASTGRAAKKKSSVRLEDLIDQVKVRAFEVFLERQKKGTEGNDIGDWVVAENDIKARHGIQ